MWIFISESNFMLPLQLTACKTHIQKRHGVVIPKGQGPKTFFAKNYPQTQKTSPQGSEQEQEVVEFQQAQKILPQIIEGEQVVVE